MDIYFQDPSVIPLPPAEVHIMALRAEPWSDNQRVNVFLEITPFQKRPNGEISLKDSLGDEVANISIIEPIDPKMEFTVHLRRAETKGEFTLSAIIFYLDEPEHNDEEQVVPPTHQERMVVDQAVTKFEI
jgi:hypothetical protein